MNVDITINHVVTAPGLEALLTSFNLGLQGLRMDIATLTTQLQAAAAELKTANATLGATNLVLDKVTDEETGLLVKIQTLTDLLGTAQTLPPETQAALADVVTTVADIKASVAANAAKAGAADALVPDTPV
jgi:uncharacterized protein YoxC